MLVQREAREGYLYFMQRKSGGIIKIGFTTNLTARLKELRGITGWDDLVIRFARWYESALDVEQDLHFELREFRIPNAVGKSREWYSDTEVVTGWIIRLSEDEFPPPRKLSKRWVEEIVKPPQEPLRAYPKLGGYRRKRWEGLIVVLTGDYVKAVRDRLESGLSRIKPEDLYQIRDSVYESILLEMDGTRYQDCYALDEAELNIIMNVALRHLKQMRQTGIFKTHIHEAVQAIAMISKRRNYPPSKQWYLP